LLGLVRPCPARSCNVRHCAIWRGAVWYRGLRSSPVWRCRVRQGFITVLRGLALCRTVLSCPVKLCEAWLFEAWCGLAEWSPALLGQVLLGSVGQGTSCLGIVLRSWVMDGEVMHGFSWRGTVLCGRAQYSEVLHGRVKRSSVGLGKASSWQGGVEKSEVRYSRVRCFLVRSCCAVWGSAGRSFVWHGKVFRGFVWFSDVLFGVAGFIGVLHSKVSSYCGLVKSGRAARCEAGHGFAFYGKDFILVWSGDVLFGGVEKGRGSVLRSKVRSYYGLVRFLLGLVGRVGALYCKARPYCGVVWNREVLHRMVKFCPVKYCYVRSAKVLLWFGDAKYSLAGRCSACQGKALLRLG